MGVGDLHAMLESSARRALLMQGEDGAMPAGHNGPYRDPETPVRNTSHWLITFLKAHQITGEAVFREAAQQAAAYLCSEKARGKGAFWHRQSPGKDSCNGLIGQAWTIEALAEAGRCWGQQGLNELGAEVFLQHPFDEKKGLWRRLEVDGTLLPYDHTFNHQLWFAAAGGLLTTGPASPQSMLEEVQRRVGIFMDNLENLIHLYPSGLIYHHHFLRPQLQSKLAKFLYINLKGWPREKKRMVSKAVGYHQFNLYALALLKRIFPQHPFWWSSKFASLWRYANSTRYVRALEQSPFGYPYNPPGLEMAFALEIFGDDPLEKLREKQRAWLEDQLHRCYDFEEHLMQLNTEDPITQAARIYEAARLPNLELRW